MTQITKEAIEAYKAAYRDHCDKAMLGFIPAQADEITVGATRAGLEAALPFLPISGEGKVKALEWRLNEEGWQIADTFFGGYRVERNPHDRWCWGVYFHGEKGVGLNPEDNFEAAKAAAQADFNERISSALAVQPDHDFRDLIIIGDTAYRVHSDVCRAFNDLVAASLTSSPGKDGGQEVEADASRWLVEEELPSGSKRWEVFEHELHARNVAARYNHRNKTTVTPLYTRPQPASTALVERLWMLLDDIDTLDDACKGDDAAFRREAYAIQRKRFQILSGEEFDKLTKGNPDA